MADDEEFECSHYTYLESLEPFPDVIDAPSLSQFVWLQSGESTASYLATTPENRRSHWAAFAETGSSSSVAAGDAPKHHLDQHRDTELTDPEIEELGLEYDAFPDYYPFYSIDALTNSFWPPLTNSDWSDAALTSLTSPDLPPRPYSVPTCRACDKKFTCTDALTVHLKLKHRLSFSLVHSPVMLQGSPALRNGHLMDLPVEVEGRRICAIPDTAASINAIDLATVAAMEKQTERSPSTHRSIKMADNSEVAPLFCIELFCSVPGMVEKVAKGQRLIFEVFERLATAVIIGRQALDQWNILSKCQYLLQPRQSTSAIPRCLSMGSSRESVLQFRVFLNGELVTASADTGSEVNLMSRTFVKGRGFTLYMLPQPSAITLAAGRVVFVRHATTVRVNAVDDRPGEKRVSVPDSKHYQQEENASTYTEAEVQDEWDEEFWILDDLRHPVILSQLLLDSIGAFDERASCLNLSTMSNARELCTILLDNRQREEPRDLTVEELEEREAGRSSDVETERDRLQRVYERSRQTNEDAAASELRDKLQDLEAEDEKAKDQYMKDLNIAQSREAAQMQQRQSKKARKR